MMPQKIGGTVEDLQDAEELQVWRRERSSLGETKKEMCLLACKPRASSVAVQCPISFNPVQHCGELGVISYFHTKEDTECQG